MSNVWSIQSAAYLQRKEREWTEGRIYRPAIEHRAGRAARTRAADLVTRPAIALLAAIGR